MIDSGQS